MNNVFLLIGGNMGDRLQNLQIACRQIEKIIGSVVKQSSIYETAAWGFTEQPAFFNQVLLAKTLLPAPVVLEKILDIENEMGRKRMIKMGPRIIDIDILFYNNAVINTPTLTIPHPFIAVRRFVLAPLAEMDAGYLHPALQKNIGTLLLECKDLLEVKMI